MKMFNEQASFIIAVAFQGNWKDSNFHFVLKVAMLLSSA